jgi:alpha-beta hydrolase superfamily lysophospholipase
MKSDTFTLDSDDGAVIFVRRWLPEEAPRAVLQLVHGMAEHSARYAGLAAYFCERGYAVYAHDHRGHGRSVPDGGDHGDMGVDDTFERAVGDVHRVSLRIAEEQSGLPRILCGHSMGSFMLQRVLAEYPDDAVGFALSASNGKPPAIANAGRGVARLERARLGADGKSAVLKALSFDDFNKKFKPNRTDFDWLSRDDAEVDAYITDPWCGFSVTTQAWIDFLDALQGLTDDEQLARIPKEKSIYLFAGDQDPVGDMGKGVRRLADAYRAAWLTDVELKLYPGARHETLHETNKEEVGADLHAWCERALSRAAARRAG